MIDSHAHPADWGVRPILFEVGGIEVPSYPVFMILALAAGVAVFIHEARYRKTFSEHTFYIFIAALVGGALGAKLPIFFIHYKDIVQNWPDLGILLWGKTIVGGLIGGTIGVIFIKRRLGIRQKRGDLFAPAIALGMAIGRLGCFLRGCCYGKPTGLPWGIDFGDGVMRHPTQLYESLFLFALFACLLLMKRRFTQPGALFRTLMVSYFAFRFLVEFIRVEDIVWMGLTSFQLASIAVVLYYGSDLFLHYRPGRTVHA